MDSITHSTERKVGHHQVAAALFVGSLILGGSLILSAELTKPARYEYHTLGQPNNYLIFDTETGRAAATSTESKTPLQALDH
jgi:hypothetical protein